MVRQLASYLMMLAGLGVLLRVAPQTTSASGKRVAVDDTARPLEPAIGSAAPAAAPASLRKDAVGRPGPWRATRHYFACDGTASQAAGPATKQSRAASALASGSRDGEQADSEADITREVFCVGSDYTYEVLIATVPDPRRSRLGLFTDRVLENIQRGAAKADWEYDSAWLPWQDAPDPDEKDPERRIRERAAVVQERSEPGVLLFRHQPAQEGAQITIRVPAAARIHCWRDTHGGHKQGAVSARTGIRRTNGSSIRWTRRKHARQDPRPHSDCWDQPSPVRFLLSQS